MNDKTASRRRVRAGMVAAAVAVLLTACSVSTSTSYPIGPAGSQSYRQVIAFALCMRNHQAPGWTYPLMRPGGSLVVPQSSPGSPTAHALDACRHLLPRGHQDTNVVIG